MCEWCVMCEFVYMSGVCEFVCVSGMCEFVCVSGVCVCVSSDTLPGTCELSTADDLQDIEGQ